MLWSSESESEESFHSEKEKESQDINIVEEIDSDESNEDPLRCLYMKQFEGLKM